MGAYSNFSTGVMGTSTNGRRYSLYVAQTDQRGTEYIDGYLDRYIDTYHILCSLPSLDQVLRYSRSDTSYPLKMITLMCDRFAKSREFALHQNASHPPSDEASP